MFSVCWQRNTREMVLPLLLLLAGRSIAASPAPIATNVHGTNVSYTGFYANEVEGFIGIRYAQDTGGQNRWRPPIPFTPPADSLVEAVNGGPSCPQRVDHRAPSVWNVYDYVTDISEDCLALNIWRPNGTKEGDKLPVLLYIHGGPWLLSFVIPLIC